MDDRLEKALLLSESILEDIETEKISVASVALRCIRLARLMNDDVAIKWLEYEISGYPKFNTTTLTKDAFSIAYNNGRKVVNDNPEDKRVFSELPDELESVISAKQIALQSFKSEGVSVAGEYAAIAMSNFTTSITNSIYNLTSSIQQCKRRIAILRGNYHKYALSVNLEIRFSGKVEEIFKYYRIKVDNEFIRIAPESLRKLDAIYRNLSSENPESWSQSLTTCRRLFEDASNKLFESHFPNYRDKIYKTKTDKALDITGDKYINRLYAVIDNCITKMPENTIIGSHIIHIIDWIDKLHDELCKGVHTAVTYEEASRAVIHTYMCLGDLSTVISKPVTNHQ